MRKFVSDERPIFTDGKEVMNLSMMVTFKEGRLPRKIKKKVKWMLKRVSTVEMLRYIAGNED